MISTLSAWMILLQASRNSSRTFAEHGTCVRPSPVLSPPKLAFEFFTIPLQDIYHRDPTWTRKLGGFTGHLGLDLLQMTPGIFQLR